ncbi:Uma2 family endonuclease [Sphingomonas koreensis]|nr:Uma2 family endonuclease [Sphingomonas koreensis]
MTAQLPVSTDVQRAKLTARDFWLLADSGAFEGFAKTELIEGEIWVVNSVYVWHAKTMAYLATELTLALRALGSDLVVYSSGSVDMSDDSVPEPDVSIGEDHDEKGLPLNKLALAIEVSDSTLANDLTSKAPLYARHGVPEYWVVDREGRRVIQMWAPEGDAYAERREMAFGQRIEGATVKGLAVETAALK